MHPFELVDIGLNLTHQRFAEDRDAVLQRAGQAGVTQYVLTGVSLSESLAAARLAAAHPMQMRATAGVHPHHASDWQASTVGELRELLAAPSVAAAGEMGLDYYRDFSARPQQREVFEAQLDLAAQAQQPAFLHQRDAEDDFFAILRDYRDKLPAAILHCFTGDRALLHTALDFDLHIGVTGWVCDERRGQGLRECVADIPSDRLMIETDAPFLLPRDLVDKPANRRNEPAFLPHVLHRVAALREAAPALVAEQTTLTAQRFFRLPLAATKANAQRS